VVAEEIRSGEPYPAVGETDDLRRAAHHDHQPRPYGDQPRSVRLGRVAPRQVGRGELDVHEHRRLGVRAARMRTAADDLAQRQCRDVARAGEQEVSRGGDVTRGVLQGDGQRRLEPRAGPRLGGERVDGRPLPWQELGIHPQTPSSTTGLARSAAATATPPEARTVWCAAVALACVRLSDVLTHGSLAAVTMAAVVASAGAASRAATIARSTPGSASASAVPRVCHPSRTLRKTSGLVGCGFGGPDRSAPPDEATPAGSSSNAGRLSASACVRVMNEPGANRSSTASGLVGHRCADRLHRPERRAVEPVDRDRQRQPLLRPGHSAARADQGQPCRHRQPSRYDVAVRSADRPDGLRPHLLVRETCAALRRRDGRRPAAAAEGEGLVEGEVVQERLDGEPAADRDRPRRVKRPVQAHAAEGQPEDLDLEAGTDVRVDVERRELHDGVDRQEAVRPAAGRLDAGFVVAPELHGVGRHRQVALGAQVMPGTGTSRWKPSRRIGGIDAGSGRNPG
jgi:hypothetical protein